MFLAYSWIGWVKKTTNIIAKANFNDPTVLAAL